MRQTCALDVWAAGIVMLTVCTGRYPFFKAADDMCALAELVALFGSRALQEFAAAIGKRLALSYATPALSLRALVRALRPDFADRLPGDTYDLLERTLQLNPRNRITAHQALQHSFFAAK
jgi:cell division control protein 7